MAELDMDKLHEFVGKMLGDLGGAMSVPTVRIGFRLGLFEALAEGPGDRGRAGPPRRGPHRTLCARMGAGPGGERLCRLRPRRRALQPVARAGHGLRRVRDSPVYLRRRVRPRRGDDRGRAQGRALVPHRRAASAGATSAGCLFCATGAFFRPGYVNNIVQSWMPALDGVEAQAQGRGQGRRRRLRRRLLDPADGRGLSRRAVSSASTSTSRRSRRRGGHAASHRPRRPGAFEVAKAKEIDEGGFDLVTFFDCLHDMGDPRGCARAHAQYPEGRRDLDGRRADRRRHGPPTTSIPSGGSTTTPRR